MVYTPRNEHFLGRKDKENERCVEQLHEALGSGLRPRELYSSKLLRKQSFALVVILESSTLV